MNADVHSIDERRQEWENRRKTLGGKSSNLLPGGPGGGNGNDMEPRIAKLEAHVDHIQTDIRDIKDGLKGIRDDARSDFRVLFGAIIAATLGLAGLVAKGFHWL